MKQEKTFSFTKQMPHVARGRVGHLALALLAALLGVAASPAASGAAGAADPVVLHECLLSGVNFPVAHERVERYVPQGYEIGTYGDAGVVAIWVFSCEGATAGAEIGPADFSVVGVLVGDDTDLGSPTTWPNALAPAAAVNQQWAANWPQYVVWAHTDNPGLAAALNRMGMPATTVRNISVLEHYPVDPIEQRVDVPDADTCSRIGPAPGAAHSPPDDVRAPEPPKTTEVSVPWGRDGGYQTSTVLPLTAHNTVTHCHDQLLKHGPKGGASTLHISIPVARDHFCSHPQPGCGRAEAQAGSPVARLLGDKERNDPVLAFDHERIPQVLIEAR
jgi:hypothetical protein